MSRVYCEGVSPEALVSAAKSWFTRNGCPVEAIAADKGQWIFKQLDLEQGETTSVQTAGMLTITDKGISFDIEDTLLAAGSMLKGREELLNEILRDIRSALNWNPNLENCPECATTIIGTPKYCPHCGRRIAPYLW